MDELNDKQGKKQRKKSKICVTTWGPEQREVPWLKTYSDKEFRDFDTSNKPLLKFNKNEKNKNNSGHIIL